MKAASSNCIQKRKQRLEMSLMQVTKIPKKTISVIEPKRSMIVDKEKYQQKRVAAYCRVSTDSEEQLTSYTTQKKVYTEMIAARKDWAFAGLYADEGISGTRADKRPAFKKMINDCLAGKIDYVITKSVSRFARNTVDCLDHVRILKSKGIGIFFEEQNIDTLKIDSELYLVIYAGFAQSESESMSKNVTWSYRKRFEDGNAVFVYKKLLGYRKGEDGMPEIVPEEAALVVRIFNMYLAGETPRKISAIMQAEKIRVPGKKLTFSDAMIAGVLANEKYCGDSILQKTVTIDCISKTRRKNTGEAPMYYVQNSHPAIVSRETFHKAQEELLRRKTRTPQSTKAVTASGKYSRYALTDVLICGECGSRYKRVTWTNNGKKRIVWRCINRLDYGKQYCKKSLTVYEPALQSAIVRALNKFNDEDKSTYMTLMKATIGEALGLNGCSDEVDLLQRKIDALNRKMLELINDSVQDGEDIESHEDEFKQISDTITLLKNRINAVQQPANSDGSPNDRLEQIQQVIEARKQNKFQYDDSIVRQMIECIKVYPDGKLEIIFGGGYIVEESLTASNQRHNRRYT
ncbi:MAG: recombinase family protein [Bacilli bacterium]|nr:recombinase family protein [Bacilli bacterium]